MTTLTKEELEIDSMECSFKDLKKTGIKVDGKDDKDADN